MSLIRCGWLSTPLLRKLVCTVAGLLLTAVMAQPLRADSPAPSSTNARLARYRAHLAELDSVVAGCQKQRTPEACDPGQVGANDRVTWPHGEASHERVISYDWLRALLASASKASSAKTQAPPAALGATVGAMRTPPPTIDSLLARARRRLAEDAAQTGQPLTPAPDFTAQRNALAAILARREYQGVAQTTARERLLEWFANQLNAIFGRIMSFGARLPWIGFAFRVLLLGGLCVALIWALIRIERRSRIRLIADAPGLAMPPSARDWQLWLRDSQTMAAEGMWREAIHFLYWAAIARLESRHLWPADRARTPREYLRLMPSADPRREGLAALTRTFERTWYGGRPAASADFQAASKLAAELGVE